MNRHASLQQPQDPVASRLSDVCMSQADTLHDKLKQSLAPFDKATTDAILGIADQSPLHKQICTKLLGFASLDALSSLIPEDRNELLLSVDTVDTVKVLSYIKRKKIQSGIKQKYFDCGSMSMLESSAEQASAVSIILDAATTHALLHDPKLAASIVANPHCAIRIPVGMDFIGPYTKLSIEDFSMEVEAVHAHMLKQQSQDTDPCDKEVLDIFIARNMLAKLSEIEEKHNLATGSLTKKVLFNAPNHSDGYLEEFLQPRGEAASEMIAWIAEQAPEAQPLLERYLEEHAQIINGVEFQQLLADSIAKIRNDITDGKPLVFYVPNAQKSYGFCAWVMIEQCGVSPADIITDVKHLETRDAHVALVDDFAGSGVSLSECVYEVQNVRSKDSKLYVCPLVSNSKKSPDWKQAMSKEAVVTIESKYVTPLSKTEFKKEEIATLKKILQSKDGSAWNQFGGYFCVAFPHMTPDNCFEKWGKVRFFQPRKEPLISQFFLDDQW
jgi:hypothetical protein